MLGLKTMQKQKQQQLSSAAILAGRPFSALSASEQTAYGQAREREAGLQVQAIVDNLNRQTAVKH